MNHLEYKMTELQKIRKSLLAQLDLVEKNKQDDKTVDSVVQISNTVIKAHNVELRADELAQHGEKTLNNEVFKDKQG